MEIIIIYIAQTEQFMGLRLRHAEKKANVKNLNTKSNQPRPGTSGKVHQWCAIANSGNQNNMEPTANTYNPFRFSKRICTHCGKPNHSVKDCYFRLRGERGQK